jgi:hypothetical protein
MKVIMNMPFVYSNEFSESYFKGEIPEIGDNVGDRYYVKDKTVENDICTIDLEFRERKRDSAEYFRNELIKRLNNINRDHDGECNGRTFPNAETFDVDEVYEIIDRIYFNQSEDNDESE